MQKRTRPELEAALEHAQGQATLYMLVLNALVQQRRRPIAECVERFRLDGARYTLTLYKACAAHGGIITTLYEHPNQLATITADYLDALREYYRQHATGTNLPFACALERLAGVRNKLNSGLG